MYLHLGQNVVVLQSAVVGIFDLDNATQSYITRDFLRRAEQEGRICNVCDDLPKSFVVCTEGEKQVVYLSQLSSATLLRRSETIGFETA